MPHPTSVPYAGLQAIILCGPGVSLNTFTSNPAEFPKALVPIANRPMVWYPLKWCHQMGISRIHLITPPQSAKALEAALAQNPYLTSLPSPKADILAPADLTHTTGTAEILRYPQVQAAITSDFVVLPCDLVCEVPGEKLIGAWMTHQIPRSHLSSGGHRQTAMSSDRPGLGVWYETRADDFVKGAESDFIITAPYRPTHGGIGPDALSHHIHHLLHASTTDSMRDQIQENAGLSLRLGMSRKHGRTRLQTSQRDAHIYLLPREILGFVKSNDQFDSFSEDVIGWWAKATWQTGLAEKIGLCVNALVKGHDKSPQTSSKVLAGDKSTTENKLDDGDKPVHDDQESSYPRQEWLEANMNSTQASSIYSEDASSVPEMLAYIHPHPSPMHIRRVDTSSLLLSTSLRLALLPGTEEAGSSDADFAEQSTAFSHRYKISTDASLIAPRTTINATNTLIGANTSIATFCNIKESCIGAGCVIGENVKITGSLLMDHVQMESKSSVQGCILGRRCIIGKGARLEGCEVQDGYRVPDGTVGSKGEKFSVFEGLEDGLDQMEEGGDQYDEDGNAGDSSS